MSEKKLNIGDDNEKVSNKIKFNKQQYLNSDKYKNDRDIINALIKDDDLLSIDEVDTLIYQFKRKVGN